MKVDFDVTTMSEGALSLLEGVLAKMVAWNGRLHRSLLRGFKEERRRREREKSGVKSEPVILEIPPMAEKYLRTTEAEMYILASRLEGHIGGASDPVVKDDLSPHFRDELFPANLRALFFICVYAGLNAVRTPWRCTPNG